MDQKPIDVPISLDAELKLIRNQVRSARARKHPDIQSQRKFLVPERVKELSVPPGRDLQGDVATIEEALGREPRRQLEDAIAGVRTPRVETQTNLEHPFPWARPGCLGIGAK